jgi:hypothetical protein
MAFCPPSSPWLMLLLPVLLAAGAHAQATEPAAALRAPLFDVPPTIDGKIAPDEWRGCHGFDGFIRASVSGQTDAGLVEPRRARAWIGATEGTIYVAIATQLPDEGELLTAVNRDSLRAVHDDSLEIYVNPTPDAAAKVDYRFLANSRGFGGYRIHKVGEVPEAEAWQGGWKQAHGMHEGWWHAEVAIPIAGMCMVAPGRKTTDGVWTINAARNWKPDWGWTSLTGGYQHDGLRVAFTTEPTPAVQMRFDGHPAWLPHRQVLSLHNPSEQALELTATLDLFRNRMPELKTGGPLTLAPGQTRDLAIDIDGNDPTTVFELTADVVAGGATVYDRAIKWNRATESPRWVVGRPKDAPPVDIQFAYYPSKNRMRLELDINGLVSAKDTAAASPTQITAAIREHGSQRQIKSLDFPLAGFAQGRQQQSFDLPPLEGEYDIVVRVAGKNMPTAPVVRRFERTVFPWENNPMGRSKKVYPPFTPIRVSDRSLLTVLRTHTLNDLGLLDQVVATSANTGNAKPILAAPMRYVATVGGDATPVKAEPLKMVSAQGHEAVTEAAFAAGPLRATSKQTWDYDGTVKVELTLEPTGETEVQSLSLEMPFTRETARLIHANSDRIRAPIAQAVPEGDGVVWDASKVARDDMPANFAPYVYLGSGVRGLCWFAENDRGWSWDPAKPNVDVVRRGDEVVLRVHLINRATTIREPRTITFGLLAAPVKPPLNPDAVNPHWWRYRYCRDNYQLLGTDINWFGNGSCGAVYPVNQDLSLWEILARSQREKLSEQEMQNFIASGDKHYASHGQLDAWRGTAKYQLRQGGRKIVFYYNRACCQELPEFETFKDEWMLTDLRSVGKGSGRDEIKVVPSGSFIDFHLFWYARSFEVGGNQGVYWDNWFIAPSFNTGMTAAYQRADGGIMPAAGIWGHRELAKRTFVMMNERGMLPIVFPHMSSFSPLPMLSFGTVQYDWEWKYSEGDVQDRFSREFLQLTSSGELAGVWPVPLHDHGALEADPWTQRTFSAVRIVHELDGHGGWGASWVPAQAANRKALAAPVLAMLEHPELEVYKYWEDRPQPVKAEHADVPAIVYSLRGKQALAGLASYSREDVTVTVNVDVAALGLSATAKAVDLESGQIYTLENGTFTLPIKKHDIRLLRFE